MATKKAVAKRASTNVAAIREQLAAEAASIQDNIGAPASNAISIRDKVFTLPDGTIMDAPIQLVILDFNSQNKLYEGKWDPKNPQPPVCFAISKSVKGMTPSQNSPEMQVKAGQSCDDCPMNVYGSDGDGKACKNTRVLAVVLPDSKPDDPIMTLSVPPTAIRAFDGYVSSVAKLFQMPPIGVVTTVDFHPEKSYPMPIFGHPEANENLANHLSRRDEAQPLLYAEPDVSGATSSATPKKKATRRRA